MLSTAQQVRIWCGVGVGVLLALGVFGMAGSLAVVGNTIVKSNDSGFNGWFGFVVICLAAEAVLAVITIWRLYHPAAARRAPQHQAPPSYGQPPPSYGQPPPAYGQPPPQHQND